MDPKLYYTLRKIQRDEKPPTTAVKTLKLFEGATYTDGRMKQTILGFAEHSLPQPVSREIGWSNGFEYGSDRPSFLLLLD